MQCGAVGWGVVQWFVIRTKSKSNDVVVGVFGFIVCIFYAARCDVLFFFFEIDWGLGDEICK